MSYGLGDTDDERRAQALEAQASDMERVAASLESTQPATALSLRNQVAVMRQQAAAFRQASGLPGSWSFWSPDTWPLWAKVTAGVVGSVGAYWVMTRPPKPMVLPADLEQGLSRLTKRPRRT